jgi:hypothetical protein
MGIRTDSQLDTILKDSQINMFDGLMSIMTSLTETINPQIVVIEDNWIKQTALIRLLENNFATNEQRQKAADELSRLGFNRAQYSSYWNLNYSNLGYNE